jgi:hypothetical protein
MKDYTDEELGSEGFAAYRTAVMSKDYQGAPLPTWEGIDDTRREYWRQTMRGCFHVVTAADLKGVLVQDPNAKIDRDRLAARA